MNQKTAYEVSDLIRESIYNLEKCEADNRLAVAIVKLDEALTLVSDFCKDEGMADLLTYRLVFHEGLFLAEWVSVADRLPAGVETVLIYDSAEVCAGYYSAKRGAWHYEVESGEAEQAHNVTHWMPIPKPPKL